MSPLSDQMRLRALYRYSAHETDRFRTGSQYGAGDKRASVAAGSKRASEGNSRSRVSSEDAANRIPWPLNMYPLSDVKTAAAVFHCLVHHGTDCGGSCTLLPTASVHSPDDAAAGDNSQLSPMASISSRQYAGSERAASEGNSTQLPTMSQQRVSAAAALIHELVSNPMSQQSVASAAALIHELVTVHWFPSGDHEEDDDDDHHHQAKKKAKRYSEIDANEAPVC